MVKIGMKLNNNKLKNIKYKGDKMNKVGRVMLISLITNLFLSIFKIIFGIIGLSGALVADGIHSISDLITDIFAIIGTKISMKPADYEHPFGHGNAEYLTCLLIGLTIGFMGYNVIITAINEKISEPSLYIAIISLITIAIKLLLSSYILKKGKEYDSNILISSGSESFTDVISSLVVFLSILLSKLSNINKIFAYSDKVAMIIVGILILKIAYEILKENISNLLGKQVLDIDYINNIKSIIKNHKEIKNIDSLIIVKYGINKKIDCEVSMNEDMTLKKAHQIIDNIEREIKEKDLNVSNIIIHVNPYEE